MMMTEQFLEDFWLSKHLQVNVNPVERGCTAYILSIHTVPTFKLVSAGATG